MWKCKDFQNLFWKNISGRLLLFLLTLQTLSMQLSQYRTLSQIIFKDSLTLSNTDIKKHLIFAIFEYLVVRYYREKIQKPVWYIKCMLFTRHSEFYHQSFNTFVSYICLYNQASKHSTNLFLFTTHWWHSQFLHFT